MRRRVSLVLVALLLTLAVGSTLLLDVAPTPGGAQRRASESPVAPVASASEPAADVAEADSGSLTGGAGPGPGSGSARAGTARLSGSVWLEGMPLAGAALRLARLGEPDPRTGEVARTGEVDVIQADGRARSRSRSPRASGRSSPTRAVPRRRRSTRAPRARRSTPPPTTRARRGSSSRWGRTDGGAR